MSSWNNSLNDLNTVQKLMTYAANHPGHKRRKKSIDGDLEKSLPSNNQALTLSNNLVNNVTTTTATSQTVKIEQESIHLKELIGQLAQIDHQMAQLKASQHQELVAQNNEMLSQFTGGESATTQTTQTTHEIVISHRETIEMKLVINSNKKIDGLVIDDRNNVESDRYLFNFNDNGTELSIIDKWTQRSTKIWGDPHIDVNDVEGQYNGEFSDLTTSDSHTTFMLMDGTRVTFQAGDHALIESVDIIKGNQRVHGTGQASTEWNEQNGLFNEQVLTDGYTSDTRISRGDVVFAGGDGNDWFTADKQLVWGTTTGPTVTTAPASRLEFTITHTIQDSISFTQVDKSV